MREREREIKVRKREVREREVGERACVLTILGAITTGRLACSAGIPEKVAAISERFFGMCKSLVPFPITSPKPVGVTEDFACILVSLVS